MIKKVIIIGLISLVLCFLFLLGTEGVLRLAGYGESHRLFLEYPQASQPSYRINTAFYYQYFPAPIKASLEHTVEWGWPIPKRKDDDTYRIFVFGGSVAAGDSMDSAFSFTRILECMLRDSFPKLHFEVYNLACPALNSHVMRAAAKEAAALKPDFFVIYMGHNEYFPWAKQEMPPSAATIQWRMALKELRVFQVPGLLQAREAGIPDDITDARLFFESAIKMYPDAPGRQRLYQNFSDNLEAICRSGTQAGAEIVLSTLGANLRDVPPFASLHRPGLTEEALRDWEAHFQKGCEAVKPGSNTYDLDEACASFERALAIDSDHAETNYQWARCLLQRGDADEALKYFSRARDYDGFFIRADSRINEIVRRSAADWSGRGVHLADTEAIFTAQSHNGIMGNDFFYDNVHVLFEGYHRIALSIFNVLEQRIAEQQGVAPAKERLAVDTCKERLGLSPYLELIYMKDVLQQLGRYQTFAPQMDGAFMEKRISEVEAKLSDKAFEEALAALDKALSWWGDDFQIRRVTAQLLMAAGRDAEAQAVMAQIMERYSDWPAAQNFKKLMDK